MVEILKSFLIFIGFLRFKFPKHNLRFKKIVHLDPNFGAIEKKAVKDAFEHWNKKTNNLFIWDLSDDEYVKNDNRVLVNRAFSDEAYVKKIEKEIETNTLLGYATYSENLKNEFIVLVIDRIDSAHFLWLVTLHEIGHNLLLEHNNKKSIMNSKVLYLCSGVQDYDLECIWKIWKDKEMK